MYIRLASGEPFAFAGLWERWRDPLQGGELFTFTLVTTAANELVVPLHERMPLIIAPGDYGAWLDPGTPRSDIRAMLAPWPAQDMEAWPVSPRVNRPDVEEPGLTRPLG
jgi:putative SOS response-associated peptidase YedK